MNKYFDPDLMGMMNQLADIKAKEGKGVDTRAIYTPSDQLYPPAEFRPDYVDPSFEKPVTHGMASGGAEEAISPIDLLAPEVPSAMRVVGREVLEAAPRLIGNEIGAIGKNIKNQLPDSMRLLDRIKLATERSNVKVVPTFEQAANEKELERLKNLPKDYFEKARKKATENDFKKLKSKLEANSTTMPTSKFDQIQRLKDSGFSDEEISDLLSRYSNDSF